MQKTNTKKHSMKCPKCGYEWKTKSSLKFVSCPSCLHKVENPHYNPLKQKHKR